MAQKYYVIWQGHQTGIFTDWTTCKRHIDGYPGARYKSYKTRLEAEQAFAAGAGPSLGKARAEAAAKKKRPAGANALKTWTTADIDALDVDVKIFTDGGCEPNPGQAGSGLAVYRGGLLTELYSGLYEPRGTNNTAELNALHHALQLAADEVAAGRTVAVFADSSYAIQCVTKWAFGWEKKGWRKQGGEIANLNLIQPMFALYKRLGKKVQVLHVNGHVGVEGNELADRMSIHAIDKRVRGLEPFPVPDEPADVLKMRKG
ncbi:viroplasmin family protein [bacterium]|nr:viroplasmin family protein [bacterium]